MFRTAAVLLVLLLAAPAPRADAATQKAQSSEPAPTESKPAESKPKPSDAPVKPSTEPSMEFDLLEPSPAAAEAPQAVDPKLERDIARRRTMLTIHQAVGLTTAAALATTVVVGQLNFNDRYRGFGDTGRYKGWHTGLAIGTTTLFASTGLLGLLAPTPFKKEFRWDTITLHKIFMSVATVGMLTQMVLGIATAGQEGQLSQVDLARAHQVIGYATMGALTAGALVIVF